MGKFEKLVDSLAGIKGFRAKYRIPLGVGLEYWFSDQIFVKRRMGQVAIPMIAFIKG